MKKLFALLLAVAMVLSMVACGSEKPADTTAADTTGAPVADDTTNAGPVVYTDPYADLAEDYDALSTAIYEDILGEFYAMYEEACAESLNLNRRYALMAIAEAKLMEAAVMLPLNSQGGNYAIGRVAPYTVGNCDWGFDDQRVHTSLVTTMPITSADRDTMKAKFNELQGSGEYLAWAEQFLIDEGYELKDSYTTTYSGDPTTWDILATSRTKDSYPVINTINALIEYDAENVVRPALAESWEIHPDGLTYPFKIREGVIWVDAQGREVAKLTADDFVAGFQHMMDACGGLEYLAGCIVGCDEYVAGEITDMAEVGVKAVDEYTLQYTLEEPTAHFMSMLTYGMFLPMSRTYYESQGGQFGEAFDASAESYVYGTSSNNIAYCGPYVVKNHTAENTIVWEANDSFWNKDAVKIKTYTWLYNDGSDQAKYWDDMVAGVTDACGLTSARVEMAKAEALPEGYTSESGATNWYDEYKYLVSTSATSYMGFFNINRMVTANVADGAAVSTKTEEDVLRGNAAMRNEHFRRALAFSIDRGTREAQSVGEELKYASMRNTYVPGDFVRLDAETTIAINGEDVTFPAGTLYGEIMQAQIDADGVAIKVWDPTQEGGVGSTDYFDGWYNPDNAVAELQIAIEELAAIGIEVSAENPIYVDLPYASNSETYTNQANAMKQSVDSVLGGAVILNLVECVDYDEWYNTGYDTSYGYEANYDVYDLAGWGPDYGDPSSYLDTFLPDYAGYMIKCIGIF